MILLLGSHGYIGREFVAEMQRQGIEYVIPEKNTRTESGYLIHERFIRFLKDNRPDIVINCAAYIAGGKADLCEDHKVETIVGNLLYPMMVVDACQSIGSVFVQVSTGCLFNGDNGGKGFSEDYEPHLSFRTNCGIYVGSKEMAEQYVRGYPSHYICRIRLPFDCYDHERNYLSKLQRYTKAVRATNSLSHRGDFVKAVLWLCQHGAAFGTYNVMNPGAVDSAWICDQINRILKLNREFVFWDDEEFLSTVARTPKSNCKLDVSKLLGTGFKMRPVEEAIIDSLKNWVAENPTKA